MEQVYTIFFYVFITLGFASTFDLVADEYGEGPYAMYFINLAVFFILIIVMITAKVLGH